MTRKDRLELIKRLKYSRSIGADYTITDEDADEIIKVLEQEPHEDCISRQVVLDKIKEVCFSKEQKWIDFRVSYGAHGQRDLIINFIESLPSATPQSKIGHWIALGNYDDYGNESSYKCSDCGDIDTYSNNYCPNCGRRMIGIW